MTAQKYIATLETEIERLRAENAALREAMDSIVWRARTALAGQKPCLTEEELEILKEARVKP